MAVVLDRTAETAPPIALLGVHFDNVTTGETVGLIEQMVTSGRPHYLATANVDFLVQALHDVELRRILMDAHLVLCDGTPLLWASRWLGNPLPERVAGSDLVPLLIKIAAKKKYRIFFLGGTPVATAKAVENLQKEHPDLIISGYYSPPFSKLLEMDHEEISRRVREAKPDLMFVSFGCPKQEKWIAMHYRALGVPVSVGVGATIDFLAGTARRAPHWMRGIGCEWIFRMLQEPKRLGPRYFADLWHFSQAIVHQWWRMRGRRARKARAEEVSQEPGTASQQRIRMPRRLDVDTVRRHSMICEQALSNSRHCLLELANVEFIDSTGMGLLIRLQKKARIAGGQLILLAPSRAVQSALRLMRLQDFFQVARDMAAAQKMVAHPAGGAVRQQPGYYSWRPSLSWRGEVTAANADEVWQFTQDHLEQIHGGKQVLIDLTDLQFIDSTGLGVMIRAKKKALQKGLKVTFTGPQPNVRNVLKLANLEKFLLEKAT